MWPAGEVPIDLDAKWPASLIKKIVSSFSTPGERVVLAAWPGTSEARPVLGVVGADGVVGHAPGSEPDAELDDARHVVEHLGRTVSTERVPPDRPHDTTEYADLVITSVYPAHLDGRSSDLVTLFAARRLRTGGIFVVLTHCDWSSGELTDPTGQVVISAQNADLLYLQHVVVLHVPVRNGALQLSDEHLADTPKRDAVLGILGGTASVYRA